MMPASQVLLFPEAGDLWVHLSSALSSALCQRSRGRKQAPRGFNHFAIKAKLLCALIQAELLGSRAGLSAEQLRAQLPHQTTAVKWSTAH